MGPAAHAAAHEQSQLARHLSARSGPGGRPPTDQAIVPNQVFDPALALVFRHFHK